MDVPRQGAVRNVCAVRCCSRTYLHPNVRLFRFPKDPERCKKWATACNQMVLYRYALKAGSCLAKSYYRVCNRHFKDHDYTDFNKKRLNSCAVPSLNLTKEEILKSNEEIKRAQSAQQQFEFIDIGDVTNGYTASAESVESSPNEKCCQTEHPWAVAETTQMEGTKTRGMQTQTASHLLTQAPQYVELRKKVQFLTRRVRILERKLDIETKKHRAKHEMLAEILQKR